MTELAALSLRLGRLPSEVLREDPAVVDEMTRLLLEQDQEQARSEGGPTSAEQAAIAAATPASVGMEG